MATYPDDAKANVTEFAVLATDTFTNTGASETSFNLSTTAVNEGEIFVTDDGVTVETNQYSLSNGGGTVNFTTAPNSSELVFKTISLPSRFRISRKVELTSSVSYNNTSPVITNSNTFLINANTVSFALPASASVTDANSIFVTVSGIMQSSNSFTFPSEVYGSDGIDIGDNTATKLLLNFESDNTTDESNNEQTDLNQVTKTFTTTKKFGSKALDLSGASNMVCDYGNFTHFDIHNSDATIEAHVRLDSLSANATIFSRFEDADDYYVLRFVGANNKLGFASKQGTGTAAETEREVYGGTITQDTYFHVALTISQNSNEMALYVDGVRVATDDLTGLGRGLNNSPPANANAIIGSFNNAELFNGKIDGFRFSSRALYSGAGLQLPLSAPTKIGGGALGSSGLAEVLNIRTIQGTVEKEDRFTSMADRKPDTGFAIDTTFDVATFSSQAGYEKRRLKSRRSKRQFQIKYSNLHGVGKRAIDEFFKARSGSFDSFTFDLSHLNETGTATVRFDGPLKVQQVLSASSNLRDNFFTVSFTLNEVFD